MRLETINLAYSFLKYTNFILIITFLFLSFTNIKFKLSNSKYAIINILFLYSLYYILNDYRWLSSRAIFKIHPIRIDNLVILNIYVFLIADFSFFLSHWLQHKIKTLWHLHKTHHKIEFINYDVHYRHSPLLIPIQMIINLIICLVFNLHLSYYAFYISIISIYQIVLHSNSLTFYERLSFILILPQHHRMHHLSTKKHVNYGGILSIWDKLFGTHSTQKKINEVYGI
jgi:sterol desaturase/sphingolipid hydroxylase (fatty acid hydroxylase superfamily)